jgi:hypothetical protein
MSVNFGAKLSGLKMLNKHFIPNGNSLNFAFFYLFSMKLSKGRWMYFATTEALTDFLQNEKYKRDYYYFIASADYHRSGLALAGSIFRKNQQHFFGATFPAIFYRGEIYQKGFWLIKFQLREAPALLHGDDDLGKMLGKALSKEKQQSVALPVSHFLLYNRNKFELSGFFEPLSRLGHENSSIICIGSGDSKKNAPVFFVDGEFSEYGIFLSMDYQMSGSIRHGFSRRQGPYRITKSAANIIYEIDHKRAGSIYLDYLKHRLGLEFLQRRRDEAFRNYPLGLFTGDIEDKIISIVDITQKGEIICGVPVAGKDFIAIMEGDPENKMEGAQQAVKESLYQQYSPAIFVVENLYRYDSIESFSPEIKRLHGIHPENREKTEIYGLFAYESVVSLYGEPLVKHLNSVGAYHLH